MPWRGASEGARRRSRLGTGPWVARIVLGGLLLCGFATPSPAAEPHLQNLSVIGPSALFPAFTADRWRYAVFSDGGDEPLSLLVEAEASLEILVQGEPVASGTLVPLPTTLVGSTLVVRVSEPATVASTVYEIQFLPVDFPRLQVNLMEEGVAPGLLYVSPRRGRTGPAYVAVLDNLGVPSFYLDKRGVTPTDFKLHADGRLSFHQIIGANEFGRRTGERVLLDLNLKELGAFQTVGLNHTDGHDFLLLPNGNLLFLAYHSVIRDVMCCGGSGERRLEDTVVQEVTPQGEVVFQWSSWGAIPLEDQLRPHATDYAHGNALDVDAQGDILVSLRGTSQVVKIDRASGAVVWKLGGLSSDFTFVDDPLEGFCGQHTAFWLPNGHLMLFDNGNFCAVELSPPRGEVTRIVEYALDEEAMTARLVRSYQEEGRYTTSTGSVQHLPNGNLLIGWGRNSDPMASITEIDPAGRRVYDATVLMEGETAANYRVFRFEPVGRSGAEQPCHGDRHTLCLGVDRFESRGVFRDQQGHIGPLVQRRITADTGVSHFGNAANIEVAVKVLNGCGINQHHWVFATGLTSQEVDLRVRDSYTGSRWEYHNPLFTPFVPVFDTQAIPCSVFEAPAP